MQNKEEAIVKSWWKSRTIRSIVYSFGFSLFPIVTALYEEGFQPYLVASLVGTVLYTLRAIEGRTDATAIIVSPSFLPGPTDKNQAIAVANKFVEKVIACEKGML
jgi:hypothetical protein